MMVQNKKATEQHCQSTVTEIHVDSQRIKWIVEVCFAEGLAGGCGVRVPSYSVESILSYQV